MRTRVFRFLLSLSCSLLLTQCMVMEEPISGGSYSSGYSSDYYDGPSYYSRPSYSGSPYYGSSYYGPRYYNSGAVCPRCHHNPCCCPDHGRSHEDSGRTHVFSSGGSTFATHSDHDHDSHRSGGGGSSSSSSQRRNDSGDKVYRYSSSDRDAPKGNHTHEWYKDRGYDMSKLRPSR